MFFAFIVHLHHRFARGKGVRSSPTHCKYVWVSFEFLLLLLLRFNKLSVALLPLWHREGRSRWWHLLLTFTRNLNNPYCNSCSSASPVKRCGQHLPDFRFLFLLLRGLIASLLYTLLCRRSLVNLVPLEILRAFAGYLFLSLGLWKTCVEFSLQVYVSSI